MYFQFSLNNGSNPDICTSVKQNLNNKDTTDVDLVHCFMIWKISENVLPNNARMSKTLSKDTEVKCLLILIS